MASKPSLVEVLGRYSLTEQQIDVACSHEHMVEIASKVNKWDYLAFHIGLDDADVTDIEHDKPHGHRSQCVAALLKWRQKFGSNATYLSLAKGLEKVSRLDLVEAVCKMFIAGRGASISPDPTPTKCSGTKTEVTLLSDKLKDFEERFKSLVNDTLGELEKNSKVTAKKLTFDLTLLPSDIKDNHVDYIERKIKNLTKAEDLTEIFYHLNLYWDSFNYTLLEMIVNNHGSAGLKDEMTDYIRDLRQFWRQTTVAEYIRCKRKKRYTRVPKKLAEVTCKLDKPVSQCTLLELEELRSDLCQRYNLEKFALMLFDVDAGSVTVTWLVSRELQLNFENRLEDVTSTEIWTSVYLLLVDGKCVSEKVSDQT